MYQICEKWLFLKRATGEVTEIKETKENQKKKGEDEAEGEEVGKEVGGEEGENFPWKLFKKCTKKGIIDGTNFC